MHIQFHPIVLLLPVLAFLITLLVWKRRFGSNRIAYHTEIFSESTQPLPNPYCGFYHIIGYTLSDDDTPSPLSACEIDTYTEALALLEINLKNYRASKIGERGLAQLNAILAAWAGSPHGTRLILRFLYDWDGAAFATEPDSLDLVLTHMEQIRQAVNCFCDSVYIMQGVFIGNWGEMHHSKFSDADSVKTLIYRLSELIDPSVYLAVRTPSLWRTVSGLYEPPERFSFSGADNSLVCRLGLFNDGILGSESDLGTYGNTLKRDAVSPGYQGTRKEELEFQKKLCRYVPNGGEVVYNNRLSEPEIAASALRTMHVSYLNADYDSRVLEKWKSSVWTGNDAFHGCDGYTYIKAHLGYRYRIHACEMKTAGLIKPVLKLRLTIGNSGFSNTLKPFEASVMLVNGETGECIRVPFRADFRELESGNRKGFTVKLPMKPFRRGTYRIYFSVKDKASGQPVFLGNTNELTKNGYLLGTVGSPIS